MWQDAIFGPGNLIFLLALVPTIRAVEKPRMATSVLTSITLVAFVVAHVSLRLWWAAAITTIEAGAWGFLAWQVLRRRKEALAGEPAKN